MVDERTAEKKRYWIRLAMAVATLASAGCESGCGRSSPNDTRHAEASPNAGGDFPGAQRPMRSDGLMASERRAIAVELMTRFAERTGVTSSAPPRRYLWTDAFAVCNFLGLGESTGDQRYTDVALRLIDQVHAVLGRHRPDDPRKGFISGLSAKEATVHPTAGGLRIGKDLPERSPSEPSNQTLEWDRDGQYFHYLVQWMHALDQAARRTHRRELNRWARELGAKAFDAFTYRPPGDVRRRMYWKMSIDLSRPLVASMGQHDPLDGYVTYLELQSGAADSEPGPDLAPDAAQYAMMLEGLDLRTADPLGIGGLLVDVSRLVRLPHEPKDGRADLARRVLTATRWGLERYADEDELRLPANRRLAFRELGLAIGLHALESMQRAAAPEWSDFFSDAEIRKEMRALTGSISLRDRIEAFWLESKHQKTETWTEHRDINDVMLATTLTPAGFLGL